ncbi:hypothetical protein [Pedobacter aquatilis]|uniref:hypothetical protein n=1 Tax=Pedobacter aquatilis TaxID=351343 RepID=UPI002931184B|nr:hypothetical protein [Pedobacter aquatilis]
MKNKILNRLLLALVAILLLNACNEQNHKDSSHSTEKNANKMAHRSTNTKVTTYIDDFENFRNAIYKEDLTKMKTFFYFPLRADTTQIWEAIYDNMDQGKRPETTPSIFTSEDFEKNYEYLFTDAFVQSLQKIDGKQLYEQGEFTTAKTSTRDRSFYMLAHFDNPNRSLQLSLMFSGWKDENGEEMSEGESAIIFFFKVTKTNHLVFDKILFAG